MGLEGDVWIAADGTPRRFSFQLSVPATAGAAQPVSVRTTIETFDFGAPVSIPTPTPDDTLEAPNMTSAVKMAFA